MASKPPTNHVTRHIRQRLLAMTSGELPVLDEAQMGALMAAFPQRCIGQYESVETYRWYAAKAELVADLAAIYEEAHTQAPEPAPEATPSKAATMMEANIRTQLGIPDEGTTAWDE